MSKFSTDIPMTFFMLSQLIAAISFCSDLIAFYLPKRVYVLRTLALSTFLLSVHFLLLGQHSSAAMMFLACIRFLVATRSTDKRLVYFFLLAALASCAHYRSAAVGREPDAHMGGVPDQRYPHAPFHNGRKPVLDNE